MDYKIKIEMSSGLKSGNFASPKERFNSAVECARQSIASILYDYPVNVENTEENGVIRITTNTPNLFTVDELETKLKTSFVDRDGHVYTEFDSVEICKKLLSL